MILVDQLAAVARRQHAQLAHLGGISAEACVVLAAAELSGCPLDVWDFDDAAVVLRAEALVVDGLAASEALVAARAELATWAERAGGAPA